MGLSVCTIRFPCLSEAGDHQSLDLSLSLKISLPKDESRVEWAKADLSVSGCWMFVIQGNSMSWSLSESSPWRYPFCPSGTHQLLCRQAWLVSDFPYGTGLAHSIILRQCLIILYKVLYQKIINCFFLLIAWKLSFLPFLPCTSSSNDCSELMSLNYPKMLPQNALEICASLRILHYFCIKNTT